MPLYGSCFLGLVFGSPHGFGLAATYQLSETLRFEPLYFHNLPASFRTTCSLSTHTCTITALSPSHLALSLHIISSHHPLFRNRRGGIVTVSKPWPGRPLFINFPP